MGVAASGTWKGVWRLSYGPPFLELEMFAKGGQKPSLGRLPCGSGWIQGSGLCMSGSRQENGCIALRETLASGGSDV